MLSTALIWAAVPMIVTELVPLLFTVAPLPPAVTFRTPSPTDSVTVSEPAVAVDVADRKPVVLQVETDVLGHRIARRRDRRERRIVDLGDVEDGGVGGRKIAAAGIAVIVDGERQARGRARIVVVLDVAHRRGGVRVQQRIDLRERAGDRHRSRAAVRDGGAARPRRNVEDAVADRERHRLGSGIAVDVADREAVVLQTQRRVLGDAVACRRDGRDRRVVDGRDVDGRGIARRQVSAAGITVVVDQQRQRRARGRIVAAVGVAQRRCAVGIEQCVDLRRGPGDGYRRRAAVGHDRAAAARRHRERAFIHRERHGLRAGIAVDVADRKTAVLQVERGLLGRRVGRRRDDRDRRIVHRRDVDDRGVGGGQPAAGVDMQRQCGAGGRGVGVVDVADHRRDVGVEQRVDLRHRTGDRHRRGVVAAHAGAAGAGFHVQRAFSLPKGSRFRRRRLSRRRTPTCRCS